MRVRTTDRRAPSTSLALQIQRRGGTRVMLHTGAMSEAPSFSDVIVFESGLVRIGAFRCDRGYPGFHDTGPASHDCFVFPRTAVQIEHEHAPPFVANPNVVT